MEGWFDYRPEPVRRQAIAVGGLQWAGALWGRSEASSAYRSTEGFRRDTGFGGSVQNWYENEESLISGNSLRKGKRLLGVRKEGWTRKASLCLIAQFVEPGSWLLEVVHERHKGTDSGEGGG